MSPSMPNSGLLIFLLSLPGRFEIYLIEAFAPFLCFVYVALTMAMTHASALPSSSFIIHSIDEFTNLRRPPGYIYPGGFTRAVQNVSKFILCHAWLAA